jgi:xylulose-5-phosphate/fructose-6-phosphate phosphoketolase
MTSRECEKTAALDADEARLLDAWWRACNYLAVGMIYLRDNPLLRRPLVPADVKRRPLGHWGSSPGLSFMYTHLNRCIRRHDLNAIFLAGPGHGAPGVLAPAYLEGTYGERYPDKGAGEDGMRRFFQAFSFPGGIPRHRDRSTRAANSATACRMPSARLSTIRICWSPSRSVTARRRPGRWRPRGIRTNS